MSDKKKPFRWPKFSLIALIATVSAFAAGMGVQSYRSQQQLEEQRKNNTVDMVEIETVFDRKANESRRAILHMKSGRTVAMSGNQLCDNLYMSYSSFHDSIFYFNSSSARHYANDVTIFGGPRKADDFEIPDLKTLTNLSFNGPASE